jgi:predicted MPP superfamily phosphohydrolase
MKMMAIIFFSLIAYLGFLLGEWFIPDLAFFHIRPFLLWTVHLLILSILVGAPFAYRIFPIENERPWYKAFQWMAYHAMGFYFIFAFFLLLRSIFVLFFTDAEITRPILTLVSFIVSISATYLGYLKTKKMPEIIEIEIPIKNLVAELENFKIVQLSDIHVGQTIKKDFVERIVEITNSLSADLICLTGDLVDGKLLQLKEEVEPFKNFKAKYGVFYVPGNHEYYWGVRDWLIHFKNLNFHILLNNSEKIEIYNRSILVAGVHDYHANRIDIAFQCLPDVALKTDEEFDLKILLAHQPNTVKKIKINFPDLVLSGHTHSGQFFPASILIYFFQRYVRGLHLIKNSMKNYWLYVNTGTGYWGPPNRFGTRSEITLIKLKRVVE